MKAAIPSRTIRTERWNSSSLPSSVEVWRLVRWGRMLVETAWKSCSGARAIISTLKMNPAAAAPCRPRAISGPALRKACSLNMISSTAAAKPPAVAQRELLGLASRGLRAWPRLRRFSLRPGAAKASGTTIRLSEGAATMPIATADWPFSRLTATSTANRVRKTDSERISAVKSPKRRWPARKPRAK